MAIGRMREYWDHWAPLFCLVANATQTDEDEEPLHPGDIHPYRDRSDFEEEKQPLDRLEHFERRIFMLPPEMRGKVLEKVKPRL